MAKSQMPMVDPDEMDDPIVFPADIIRRLAPIFEVSTTGMARLLGMSRHVVWRRIHGREPLPAEYQARAQGAVRLYARALDLCWYQTVNGRRETRRWLNAWLPYTKAQEPVSVGRSRSSAPTKGRRSCWITDCP